MTLSRREISKTRPIPGDDRSPSTCSSPPLRSPFPFYLEEVAEPSAAVELLPRESQFSQSASTPLVPEFCLVGSRKAESSFVVVGGAAVKSRAAAPLAARYARQRDVSHPPSTFVFRSATDDQLLPAGVLQNPNAKTVKTLAGFPGELRIFMFEGLRGNRDRRQLVG